MLFSSLEFLFLFLPLTVAVYFATPARLRNGVLLLCGLVFYGFGEPKFLPLMAATISVDFCLGLGIEWACGRLKRVLLWLAVAINVGTLAFFKYFDPFEWGLPIGISFYTFQALSYVIDVYRGQVSATRSAVDFGAYVVLFPQLIAGPIVRYSDVAAELRERRHSAQDAASGLRTFACGLAKKVMLANPSGLLWERLATEDTFVGRWLAIFFFAAQIYFDFSGYSDMAVGLGRMLGFRFPQNFNYPYAAFSITDFWRRWHITLSSFFREYVYIPLGGNRRGRGSTVLNLLITWGLTGLWHGAEVNFLLWGLYFAIVLIVEKMLLGRLLQRLPRAVAHIYALVLIALGWVIFVSDGSLQGFSGLQFAAGLFGVGNSAFANVGVSDTLLHSLPFAVILALGAVPLPHRIYVKLRKYAEKRGALSALLDIILPICALLLSVAYIVGSGYNPFLYFRF